MPGMQEITHRVVVPELAFTGDTTAEFFTDPANEEIFKARLLIMECSFLDDAMSPEDAKVHCGFNVTAHTSQPLHLPRRTYAHVHVITIVLVLKAAKVTSFTLVSIELGKQCKVQRVLGSLLYNKFCAAHACLYVRLRCCITKPSFTED